MLADDHRTAAEDIETSITSLSSVPRSGRIIIEGAWGAAFHWIAYGCATAQPATGKPRPLRLILRCSENPRPPIHGSAWSG